MTLSTMDPTPALVVVDLQQGLAGLPTVHPLADIVARAAELAAAFRRHGLPVVLVTVDGGPPGRRESGPFLPPGFVPPPDWTQVLPELNPQPGDLRVTKQTAGAFHATALHAELQSRGVTQVVVVGVVTTMGVEGTARAAQEHGYHVVLATDAMTDRDGEAHRNSVERVFPRLGETATSAEVIAMLERTR